MSHLYFFLICRRNFQGSAHFLHQSYLRLRYIPRVLYLTRFAFSDTNENKTSSSIIWQHFENKTTSGEVITTPSTWAMIPVKQYVELPLLDRKQNPLKLWKLKKDIFPELYKLSQKYLCVLAISHQSVYSQKLMNWQKIEEADWSVQMWKSC